MSTKTISSSTLIERFWPKVDKRGEDECWPWLAAKGHFGHGEIYIGHIDGRSQAAQAHRVSWWIANGGEFPPSEIHVLHKCDNPPCVNPRHLMLGTHADNMADMAQKGRSDSKRRVGRIHPRAKLNDEQVAEIRRLRSEGGTYASIAAQFPVCESHIGRILKGIRWLA